MYNTRLLTIFWSLHLLLASVSAIPSEAQVGILFSAQPPPHTVQFMRGLEVAAEYLNNRTASHVPIRLVPLEIEHIRDRSFSLEPATVVSAALPNLSAVFDLNSIDGSVRYFVSNYSVLLFNVRDDAEVATEDLLPNEIVGRFTPYVWSRAANLFLTSINWTQCVIIMSENEIAHAIGEMMKNTNSCTVRAEYVIPRQTPDASVLLEFFRSVDSLAIRPIVFIGSPDDFAFAVAEASKSFYDFEFIWIAPPLHNPVHPHDSFQEELNKLTLGSNLNLSSGVWCISPPLIDSAIVSLEQTIQTILLSRFPSSFPSIQDTRDALLAFDLLHSLSQAIDQFGPTATVSQLQSFVLSNKFNGTTGLVHFGTQERSREGVLAANWVRSSSTTSAGQFRSVGTWSGGASFDFFYQGNYHFWHGPVPASRVPSDTFPDTVTVAMIYPLQVPEYEHWFHAAALAMSHIVSDGEFLPGYRWRFIPIDSHLDDGRAVLQSIELRSKYHPNAVIAAESNSITRSVQAVVRAENVLQLSPIASSDFLSSKTDAPLFARTGPKEYDYGHAMANFISQYGWENIALLSSLDDYGTESAKSFISAAPTIRVLKHASFRHLTGVKQTPRIALTDIKESKARILLVFASAEHFPHIFREAQDLGMLQYPYVWILGEQALLSNTFAANVTFPDGVIALAPHEGGTAVFDRYASGLEERVADIPYLASNFFIGAAEVYDVFLSLARAFDSVIKSGGDLLDGQAVFQSLRRIPKFPGASGHVAFDSKGDRLYGMIDFFNRVDGKWRSVAMWRNESNDTELLAATLTIKGEIVFLNGIRTPPTDLERLYASWSDGGGLSMTLVTSLLLIMVAGSGAVVMRYRFNPLIRASSPFFLLATLVGIALALMSNFFMVGLPSRTCGTRYWLLLLGFAISYGSLVAKNWRVWRLWSDESMKIIRITNLKLFSFLGIFVLPFIILLILWTIVDPPIPTFSGHLVGCRSTTGSTLWMIVAFAMIIMALIIGCALSFKVRKIPQLYNECRHIALATYNLAVAISIGLVLHQVLAEISYVASFLCWCLGVLFGFGGMFFIMFAPKFYLVILHPEKISELSSGRSTGRTTNTVHDSSKNSIGNSSAPRGGRGGSGRKTGSGRQHTQNVSSGK